MALADVQRHHFSTWHRPGSQAHCPSWMLRAWWIESGTDLSRSTDFGHNDPSIWPVRQPTGVQSLGAFNSIASPGIIDVASGSTQRPGVPLLSRLDSANDWSRLAVDQSDAKTRETEKTNRTNTDTLDTGATGCNGRPITSPIVCNWANWFIDSAPVRTYFILLCPSSVKARTATAAMFCS
jgi:hypothetical protein